MLPELKATPGFLAVRHMVNRSTGEGVVGTIWVDEDAMRSNEAAADERRQRGAAQGIQISEPSYRTVLFSHLV